jgi:hypothetical protein
MILRAAVRERRSFINDSSWEISYAGSVTQCSDAMFANFGPSCQLFSTSFSKPQIRPSILEFHRLGGHSWPNHPRGRPAHQEVSAISYIGR